MADEKDNTTNDGGQAFPVPAGNFSGGEGWDSERGMTLRDYFAGQALVGVALGMNSDVRRRYLNGEADGREATFAYLLADAMIAERVK